MMAIQKKLVVGVLVLFSSLGAGLLLWGLLWGLWGWPVAAQAPGASLAAVWANEGGDKVTRDELRATADPSAVHNSVWDGTSVTLFGARNEVLGFNLVLEAPARSTGPLQVSLTHLDGVAATITTTQATSASLFSYLGRSIELFFVRYLEIEGISRLAYEDYDERHVPERCRRPYTGEGEGSGLWTDRPCHNKLYPEIAVPLALQSPFTIPAGTNQSIWVDIYIPKSTPAGVYSGTIEIQEAGSRVRAVPVRLSVFDFALPDLPSAGTMLFFSQEEINHRYLGAEHRWPEAGTAVYTQGLALADRHVQLAHRHKISMIEGSTPLEQMGDGWVKRLSGELFTPAYGYDDPAGWTNLFRQAQTFGCYTDDDPVRGKSGWNYNNGDGVLFYPGTESVYPEESYGVAGPLASLRLKQWRRGIQDVDYLTLAAAVDPAAVQQIVARLVPTVTWEYGVSDPADPTWVRADISWSTDPDVWEAARWALAQILERPRALPPSIYLPAVLARPG